jgi:hypothetical protein
MMMNYKVFFITDANATLTDAEHGGTLSAMAHTFCEVRDNAIYAGPDCGLNPYPTCILSEMDPDFGTTCLVGRGCSV